MYESSLRHPVWVPEINVKACNSVIVFLHIFTFVDSTYGFLLYFCDSYHGGVWPNPEVTDPKPWPVLPAGLPTSQCEYILYSNRILMQAQQRGM